MDFDKRPARIAATLAAVAMVALTPAGAAADGLVSDNPNPPGGSIDYQGDPLQDALLTLDMRTTDNGAGVAILDAINNVEAEPGNCVELDDNYVECTPARGRWTILSWGYPDVITNLSPMALYATLGAGNDTATSRAGQDHLFGQEGVDTLSSGEGDDELDGGADGDFLRGGGGRDTLRGVTGGDDLEGGDGDDLLVGGDDDDQLAGDAGADTLSAGHGDDLLEGGDGGDFLGGGAGNDRLVGGPGNDSFSGGEGFDRADYSARSVPLRISLDDVANDGQDGEGDNVTGDVEDVTGGAENDRLVGSNADNALVGGPGHDLLIGNGGADVLEAGDGDDIIQSRDGVPETIGCGPGTDSAITDEFDTPVDCESVQASRDFQPDVDADGHVAPADCDDRNPAIRPGAEDTPHNGVDEDCSGADAALPAARGSVVQAFQTRGRYTRVIKLEVVRAVVGTVVQITCRGTRCPFKSRRIRVRRAGSRVDLTALFKRRSQRAGGTVEIRVLESGRQGRITRFRFRTRRAPSVRRTCLPPEARTPGPCP